MAKTSRSKKSKQDQISEDLKVRIIATVGLFLIVVGAMKLGPIGEQLNFLCTYIIGNFVGISYISLVLRIRNLKRFLVWIYQKLYCRLRKAVQWRLLLNPRLQISLYQKWEWIQLYH